MQLVSLIAAAALSVLEMEGDPTRVEVVADGAPRGASLSLARADSSGPGLFGRQEWDESGTVLRFEPAVGLSRGMQYVAHLTNGEETLAKTTWTVPRVESAPPRLVSIHPDAPVLPANLLKFYLEFDRPMRETRTIFDRIHLEDETGQRVESPWRRQELWNADATRLTLWIHPGRIKRGVNLRKQMGPVLRPEQRYTLVIDAGVRSMEGAPLKEAFRHPFRTGAEDHERPNPGAWHLSFPHAGTREPLTITFDKPLDHALVSRYVRVFRDDAETPTQVVIVPGQRQGHLIPVHPWLGDAHEVQIGKRLEDLAGNTPERVFDLDLEAPDPPQAQLQRTFRPRTANP